MLKKRNFTLYKPHTQRLKILSGDAELVDTVRYCLVMRTNRANSCWCCFHHIRGSVSLDKCHTRMYETLSYYEVTLSY